MSDGIAQGTDLGKTPQRRRGHREAGQLGLNPYHRGGRTVEQLHILTVDPANGVGKIDYEGESPQSKGLYTHEIRDGFHYLTEGWYFVLVVEHDDGLIVVDAPPTIGSDFLGNNILPGIREISDKPITWEVVERLRIDA
ncbi:MAG: hypothetical protein L0Z47_01035 [Actinobacteria bacterium]|nr:hypothetical protein [Actinomycetota bacterium]